MGNYDPNLLPFYSLPYYSSKWQSSPNSGQHYKTYRDKSLKMFNSGYGRHLNKENLKLYAIAGENEKVKKLIDDNIDKIWSPLDYSYYAIKLLAESEPNKEEGFYPVIYLNIEIEALSKAVKEEFLEIFGETPQVKEYLSDYKRELKYHIPHYMDYIFWPNYNTSTKSPDPAFFEVLKFFFERSTFIPLAFDEKDDLLHSFIFTRQHDRVSLKWKTIKEIDAFINATESDANLLSAERLALISLISDGESKEYKPADDVFYFCKFNPGGNRKYYLKRDLDKSPKKADKTR